MAPRKVDSSSGSATRVQGRRGALRLLGAAVGAAFATAWASVATVRRASESPRRVTLPSPTAEGVSFHGDVILVNDASGLVALGARCPHLGCRVNRHEAGELVCPCHGSRFDLAGTRHAGPASGDLRRLTIHRTQPDQVDVELSG